ncbi:MAG: hypothetical protein COU85_00345 [Candidatus Portnoybacteria bacterium CG10_big_fil_rev_8_21_14_0_10_44_7]|uniref:D,D-heptose 1,7-bisphosphate phosphatase n=1 Tax=Candidatus Portnoybacteria bacterium CG10_big_fil_rev_8_21_14_0_10_44_7 TaxID=1974816 RepID=A0A2M8KJF0_9BACT|nr:MAG: hypothetical protein COU85_00345 [Candidatus Portnoybacteria bacterium CG10_big_fil_rev_8_21_14_0_10_44_7]
MTKAIFWDRDGILNYVVEKREDGLENVSPQKFEDFKLVPGASEVLRQAKEHGYLNIVVTKQPDIARGKMAEEELNKMHELLKSKMSIDAIYVCPHDRQDNCDCRKPKPGLILRATKDYDIDLNKSFMVGDEQTDIDAAKNVGVGSILLETGYNKSVQNVSLKIKSLAKILDHLGHSNP